ncbi:SDR family NAD(P)-dependent oxidoreductase [Xylanibacter brevis]|uniref:SDR family NAD(P)-dependent oxidoreductase n=1 Tax=Xylanibacter brevis TaxID=83231 RepID=UPI000484B57F|nr:SDR family oxidoreductase [Xylanibacter brevis]
MYNPFTLENKTILVTGASSGIGKATAIGCSKLGANVVVTGRNEERLNQTLSELEGNGHLAIVADLTSDDGVNELVEQCPRIDGLVNNAGATVTVPVQFISRENLEGLLQVNTIAPILLFQRLMKAKKLGKGASVVFTASISGLCCAVLGNSLYSTSKAAIGGFVKNAALELAGKNIRVNAVCPGMIDTHILDAGVVGADDLERERQKYPMKRFGKPEEVAWSIIYLLSDASSFTTGSTLVMDGGFTLL